MKFILTTVVVERSSMNEQRRLTPAQIIENDEEPTVLTARDILGDRPDESADGEPEHPREDWLWLDKEKLDRKEIVAAQSRP